MAEPNATKGELNWPPLESDPASFNKLATFLGIEGYVLHEVWGLDDELLAFLPPGMKAVIACFMRIPEKKAEDKARGDLATKCEYYMDQSPVLDNACGIIALMHSVLNNSNHIKIREDSPLAHFKAQCGATAAERCAALENNQEIHNYYKEVQTGGQSRGNEDGLHDRGDGVMKTFHFVAYVINEDKQLVEFDGTKAGPWVVAEGVGEDRLMFAVAAEIRRRLAEGEIDPGEAAIMALGPPAE